MTTTGTHIVSSSSWGKPSIYTFKFLYNEIQAYGQLSETYGIGSVWVLHIWIANIHHDACDIKTQKAF